MDKPGLATTAHGSFLARNHRLGLRFSGLAHNRLRFSFARQGTLRGLLIHPSIEARTLEAPAVAKLERGHKPVRSIFVKRVGTDAEIVGSQADVHDFTKFIPRRCCSHRSALLWELLDRARVHTRRCAYTAFLPCNTRNYSRIAVVFRVFKRYHSYHARCGFASCGFLLRKTTRGPFASVYCCCDTAFSVSLSSGRRVTEYARMRSITCGL
jgi:hypothetical protein